MYSTQMAVLHKLRESVSFGLLHYSDFLGLLQVTTIFNLKFMSEFKILRLMAKRLFIKSSLSLKVVS